MVNSHAQDAFRHRTTGVHLLRSGMGAISGALYNLFAKWVGGIEVDVAPASPAP